MAMVKDKVSDHLLTVGFSQQSHALVLLSVRSSQWF